VHGAAQRRTTSDEVCVDRSRSAQTSRALPPRRHEWVRCVQRQRSAAAAASTTSTTQPPRRTSATSISAAAPPPPPPQPVLRRQQTVASSDVGALDPATTSAAVNSESPADTTTREAVSDDECADVEHALNYQTVLRCLDSCDKILLRHSTLIT